MAQRKALALRCQQWEHVGETASGGFGSSFGSGGVDPSKVLEAKRAALPCLRNLASFVSNQGRHVDAEVVLVREAAPQEDGQFALYLLGVQQLLIVCSA